MFDFKEYKDFLEKEKNFFNEENKKLISFAQMYIEVVLLGTHTKSIPNKGE